MTDARVVFRPLGSSAAARLLDPTRSWVDPNGYTLSGRLWRARQADRDAIEALLLECLARGLDALTTAKLLEDYLMPAAQLTRYPADHPNPAKRGRVKPLAEQPKGVATRTPRSGLGNYAARRLVRTEVTRAFGAGTVEGIAANEFAEGVRWNLSGVHREEDECTDHAAASSAGMGPGEYRLGEMPAYPAHPHCRCYLTPVLADEAEVIRRIRADLFRETP